MAPLDSEEARVRTGPLRQASTRQADNTPIVSESAAAVMADD